MTQSTQALHGTLDIKAEFLEKKEPTAEDFRRIRTEVYFSIKIRRAFDQALRQLGDEDRTELLKKGVGRWVLGDYEGAVEILSAFKTHAVGGTFLAGSLLQTGRPAEALPLLESLVEMQKTGTEVEFDLVWALRDLQRYDDAAKALKKLAKSCEKTPRYHYELGMLHDALGEYKEGDACYDRVLELDENYSSALFRKAYNRSLRGTLDDAIDYYERCIEIEPAYEEAMLNLGTLYEDREDWEDAVDCYDAILDENPNHERARLFKKDAVSSMTMYFDEDMARRADRHNQALQIPITDFELSVRSRNCLQKMSIRTLGDLVQKTEQELLSYKNFGETSLQEIKGLLAKRGLRLGMGRMQGGLGQGSIPSSVSDDLLERLVSDLDLSIRCRNCLSNLGVETVADLVDKSEPELMSVRNFGQTSLNEIKNKLAEMNLSLKGA